MAADGPASPAERAHGLVMPAGAPLPPLELLIALRAEPTAARVVRHRMRAWLARWGWDGDDLDDIIMAVDEAVANVVDHAYRLLPEPGDVHVYAWVTRDPRGRRLTVSVTDKGRWRPVPADPGHRGRGLLMMSTCMASLHIEHSSGGTSVTMTSAAFAAPPTA
jgi:serine/threonine-protein kinase RsbW